MLVQFLHKHPTISFQRLSRSLHCPVPYEHLRFLKNYFHYNNLYQKVRHKLALHALKGLGVIKLVTTFQLVSFLRLVNCSAFRQVQNSPRILKPCHKDNYVVQVAVRPPFHVEIIGISTDELEA